MKRIVTSFLLLVGVLTTPVAWATDVDGPDDCQRQIRDFGDAPEGFDAYPGVMGKFPTCLAPGPVGTLDHPPVCIPTVTPPGPAGFVMHVSIPGAPNYWLGCGPAALPPMGVDSEPDGKTSPGTAVSFCNPNVGIDCVETVGVLSFGQDECYGSSDAGIATAPNLVACGPANIRFQAFNCGGQHDAVLNILIDYNHDGDWNDVVLCNGQCVSEWVVQNALLPLPPGCSNQISPTFRVGPNPGGGWMRITISDTAVPPDFSWNGSAGIAGQTLANGETEDYPVDIQPSNGPCDMGYEDFGDAPEGIPAYPGGLIGNFPTCKAPNPAGAANISCPPALGTAPGPDAGYVRHVQTATDVDAFWLGCSQAASAAFVDGEGDGKVAPGLGPSSCDPTVGTDCAETIGAGFQFGQDECYGDNVDAGIAARVAFPACTTNTVKFNAFSCSTHSMDVFLNVLVDWNGDGDWNDDASCGNLAPCASEWAIKNFAIPLNPGCQTLTTPLIHAGPRLGIGWMRMTLTRGPVPDDFPWNGSLGTPEQSFRGGETEDYPVDIVQSTVGVETSSDKPDGPWLALASPNPTAAPVTLRFALSRGGRVSLRVFDVGGRLVRSLVSGQQHAGVHSTAWDLRNGSGAELPPGVYLVRLEAEGQVFSRRIIRTR